MKIGDKVRCGKQFPKTPDGKAPRKDAGVVERVFKKDGNEVIVVRYSDGKRSCGFSSVYVVA